jgi:hypothetical protein
MSTRIEYVSNRTDTPEIALGVSPYDTTITSLPSSLSGVEIVGNLKVKNLSANLIFSDEINFGSLERPSLTGVKEALDNFLYTDPAFQFVTLSSTSPSVNSSSVILEVGVTLTTPTITWKSNKEEDSAITSFTLTRPNGATVTGGSSFKSYVETVNYTVTNTTATSSWIVSLVDWKGGTASNSASVIWRYRVYFGTTSQDNPNNSEVITKAQIANGGTSQLATSRTGLGVKTLVPTNQYFYFAYPTSFGATSQVRVNGLSFNELTLQTINNFTNDVGGTNNYYVYRSTNKLTASVAVPYQIEII